MIWTSRKDISHIAEHIVVILDGYQVIEASAIHAAVSFLLDHLPSLPPCKMANPSKRHPADQL